MLGFRDKSKHQNLSRASIRGAISSFTSYARCANHGWVRCNSMSVGYEDEESGSCTWAWWCCFLHHYAGLWSPSNHWESRLNNKILGPSNRPENRHPDPSQEISPGNGPPPWRQLLRLSRSRQHSSLETPWRPVNSQIRGSQHNNKHSCPQLRQCPCLRRRRRLHVPLGLQIRQEFPNNPVSSPARLNGLWGWHPLLSLRLILLQTDHRRSGQIDQNMARGARRDPRNTSHLIILKFQTWRILRS